MTWIDYMRKILIAMMTVTIAFAPPLAADDGDLSQYAEQTEQLWQHNGKNDELNDSISTTMLAWGVGLAVGIGLVAGLVHQSN